MNKVSKKNTVKNMSKSSKSLQDDKQYMDDIEIDTSPISKYSHDDKQYIVDMIERIKNKDDFLAIFEILSQDPLNEYTQNHNGIFLNFSNVQDDILDKIVKYIKKINKRKDNEIETNIDTIPLGCISNSNRTHKLSNHEKNILKQRNIKHRTQYEAINFRQNNLII